MPRTTCLNIMTNKIFLVIGHPWDLWPHPKVEVVDPPLPEYVTYE